MAIRYKNLGLARSRNRAFVYTRVWTLAMLGLTVAAIVAMALAPRIPQNESYHEFADRRSVFGISNLLNVVSNLPFLLTGMAGLLFVTRSAYRGDSNDSFIYRFERWPYVVFFIGVTLTCFGSAYYHLAPSTARLVWDRLPMSVAFMSLLAAVIAERINVRAGLVLLVPLVLAGASSVIYWHLGEQSGSGDLRPYILVQFYTLIVIILATLILPSRYTGGGELLGASLCYVLAKAVEFLDSQVLAVGWIVSGHTLKHIVAAGAIYWILHMLKHRMPAPKTLEELRESCA